MSYIQHEYEYISEELYSIRNKLSHLVYKANNNKICKIYNDLNNLILDEYTLGYEYTIAKLNENIKSTEDQIEVYVINAGHLKGLMDLLSCLKSHRDLMAGTYEEEIKKLKGRINENNL